MSVTTKKARFSTGLSKVSTNGETKKQKKKAEVESRPVHKVEIPPIQTGEIVIRLVGNSPLMVNNKMNIAEEISERYSGAGKTASVRRPRVDIDVQYSRAFYVMPTSKTKAPDPKADYGIPTSGIKKCFDKAIRTTGISDNTTIGSISRSFFVKADAGGLVKLKFKKLERDVRAVNIGSGQKTVPQMRHRPMFHGWSVDVRITFNPKIIGPDQLVNLAAHAGLYIGLHELRAEKKQGECGGFFAESC